MRLTPLRPAVSSLTTALTNLTVAPQRSFSTTPSLGTKTVKITHLPSSMIPPYPYGEQRLYQQSNRGLYGGARIRHGNNVSEKHHQITPRTWKPNVHRRKLWSKSLGLWVRTRVTTRVLRTIRKEGGLDNYVTKEKAARVKELGPAGWKLRFLVMQTAAYRQKYIEEADRLGLTGAVIPGDNTALVRVMVEHALPGGLSAASKQLLADMSQRMLLDEFAMGDEAELAGQLADEEYVIEEVGLDSSLRRDTISFAESTVKAAEDAIEATKAQIAAAKSAIEGEKRI